MDYAMNGFNDPAQNKVPDFYVRPFRSRQRLYYNMSTGEVSASHADAMQWSRDDEGVEVRCGDRVILRMNPVFH